MSFWLDVLKTLIGTFAGALLAFFVNIYLQHVERRRKEKAAGNLMLATLSNQFGDFVVAKAGFLSDKDVALKRDKTTPAWNQLQPTLFQFSDDLKVDLQALGFLIEKGKSDVLERLLIANTKYHDLAHLTRMHSEAATERQSRLETPISENPALSFERAAEVLGGELIGRLDSLAKAIDRRLENDQQIYLNAGKALRAALVELFEEEGLMRFRPLGANEKALSLVGLPAGTLG